MANRLYAAFTGIWQLGAGLILMLALTGCDTGGDRNRPETLPQQLLYASTKDIRDINPHLYAGEMAAQNMVFEPLVKNTPQGIVPCLATDWDTSPDGRTYTFYLRDGVRFTDGARFDAQAVKLNFDAVLANRSRHAWLELVRQIIRTEVVDEFTFRLTLEHPYYPALDELALIRPFRFISPNCFTDGGTKNRVSGYAGTGPWILSRHLPEQYAVFTANPDYWGARPGVESVKWRVMPDHQTILLGMEKGDVHLVFGSDGDMIGLDAFTAIQQNNTYQAFISHPIASRAILLNTRRPVTSDLSVRRALQHAVDKTGIAQGILNGSESIAPTLLSPDVPYCDVDLPAFAYDPQRASELLEEAGWAPGSDGIRRKNGIPCELFLYFNTDNSQERTISEFIQSNLKKIGIILHIVGEEKQAFLDRQKSGDFDLQYSLSWGIPYDPHSYISSWRIPAHGDYQAQLGLDQKPWLDDTITALLIEPDTEKRKAMYRDILTYIHDSCVYIPLTFSRTKAVASGRLKGVGFCPSQYEIPFEKMSFEN